MRVRVKFRKYGPVRYIGHLDVMRFFQKAIRRAEIDVAYTQGFSPHQIMTFAAPLGVGIESNGEYMDIEVHSMTSCEDMAARLNAASVPGIEIVSVRVLPDTAGNAMADVAAAAYTVRFREGREPKADIASLLTDFLAREEIPFVKTTKKGSREMNLRPGILQLMEGRTFFPPFNYEKGRFSMILNASSAGNIKPAQVMEALLAQAGETLQDNALIIVREDVYAQTTVRNGEYYYNTEEDGTALTSMGDIGSVC